MDSTTKTPMVPRQTYDCFAVFVRLNSPPTLFSWLNSLPHSNPWFAGLVLALLVAFPVFAQEARWKELNSKVLQLYQQGKYGEAISVAQEALRVAEASFGPEHANVATALNDLAALYREQGRYAAAEPLFKRSLAIREKALGPEHPDVAISLSNLAAMYKDQGQYEAAEPLFKRSLAIREKTLGPEHPKVATALNNLALLYRKQGQYGAAEPLLKRALAIREKTLGPNHPDVARSLNNLAELYREQGQYAAAETLYQRALEIQAAAEPLYKRSLAMREEALEPEHPDVAKSLNNLAALYQEQGEYEAAEPLFKWALAIQEKALGSAHPEVARSLNNLAALYQEQGQYEAAEPLLTRALEIQEKALGSAHPDVARSLSNLAGLYQDLGEYAKAEELLTRGLAIQEKTLGPAHPEVARSLNNLAGLYQDLGEYAKAEKLLTRGLAIREKTLGPAHPEVAQSLNNLAGLYQEWRQYAKAEAMLKRALAIWENALGPEHPYCRTALKHLAQLYYGWGRPRDADAFFDRAFQNLSKQFEQQFSYMSEKERLTFLSRVSSIFPSYFSFVLTYKDQEPELIAKMYDRLLWEKGLVVGSVAAQRARLASSGDQQALAMFDQVAAKKNQLAALAYTVPRDREQWRRSLAQLEREANELEKKWVLASSGDQEAFSMFDRLTAKKNELAALVNTVPRDRDEHWRRNLAQLEQEANKLEKELAQRSASYAGQEEELARPSWKQVRDALKQDEAAVEFVRFPFHDGSKWTEKSYYAALVERRESRQPQVVMLGEAKELEGAPLEDYRAWVAEPNLAEPPRAGAGRKFAERFWQPLEEALGGAKRIYVSPDGVLNQVALGVAPRDDGKLLMNAYDLRLVSSTKDLLRPAQRTAANTAVVVGNPTFDLSAAQQRSARSSLDKPEKAKAEPVLVASVVSPSGFSSSRQSGKVRDLLRSQDCPDLPPGGTLCPLKGTQGEVEAIFSELKSRRWEVAAPYTQEKALKEVVKRVKQPRLLHLATHGFFPPQQERKPSELDRLSGPMNPMLHSGLFFAGAERALRGEAPVEGLQDGVLTAYEASTLDLQGTELVVLSACGTGLGEIQVGEGVFGLWRALQEAGAQSVLMSLWSVPDTETRELMTLFYQNWLGGKDKPTALQEAQEQMRQEVKKRYGRDLPFYWGAFVLVGR